MEGKAVFAAFVCNSIFNIHLLQLPSSFSHAGLYASAFIFAFFAVLSCVLAEMMEDVQFKCREIIIVRDERTGLDGNQSPYPNSPENHEKPIHPLLSKPSTFQCFSELLGKNCSTILIILLCIILSFQISENYLLFSSTLCSHLPIPHLETCSIPDSSFLSSCQLSYTLYLLLLLLFQSSYISKPLTFQSLTQTTCFILSVSTLLITVTSCLFALISQSSYETGLYRDLPKAKSTNLSKIFEIIQNSGVFFAVQLQIATCFQENRENSKKILRWSFFVVFGILIFLCFTFVYATDEVSSDFTENFKRYSAGFQWEEKPFYAFLVSWIVGTFPAVIAFANVGIMTKTGGLNLEGFLTGLGVEARLGRLISFCIFVCFPCVLACFVRDLVIVI
jgi:hypothetical protein